MRRPHSLAALHSPRAHETPHRPGQRPREGSRLPRSAAGLRWARNHRTTADPPPTHALAPRWSHQARIRIARCTSTTSNSPSWTYPELTDSARGRRIAATNQSAPCEARRKPLSASISSSRARIRPKSACSTPPRAWEAADAAPHAASQDVSAIDDLTAHLQKATNLCRRYESARSPE